MAFSNQTVNRLKVAKISSSSKTRNATFCNKLIAHSLFDNYIILTLLLQNQIIEGKRMATGVTVFL